MTTEEIKSTFKNISQHENELTENGKYFIHSLKKYYTRNKMLSGRQQKALMGINQSIKN